MWNNLLIYNIYINIVNWNIKFVILFCWFLFYKYKYSIFILFLLYYVHINIKLIYGSNLRARHLQKIQILLFNQRNIQILNSRIAVSFMSFWIVFPTPVRGVGGMEVHISTLCLCFSLASFNPLVFSYVIFHEGANVQCKWLYLNSFGLALRTKGPNDSWHVEVTHSLTGKLGHSFIQKVLVKHLPCQTQHSVLRIRQWIKHTPYLQATLSLSPSPRKKKPSKQAGNYHTIN